jgi:hypothetical protein
MPRRTGQQSNSRLGQAIGLISRYKGVYHLVHIAV